MSHNFDYIHDPQEISAESFRRIDAAVDFSAFHGCMQSVATRIVHASAMPEVTEHLKYSEGAAEAGRDALKSGAVILVDAEMVARGITKRFLPANNEVRCDLTAPGVADAAKKRGETRSAIAVEHWGDAQGGAVCVIGNAPTALFRLLERITEGAPKPALIIGLPVGFVGAFESKAALAQFANGVPFITLEGRLGGSAMAAAALNAIALLASGGND